MSSLAYTVSFVRMGRAPFGHKPKDVAVFAQHLAGGSGLTLFHTLEEPGLVLRVRDSGLSVATHLMAGFAVAENRVPLEDEARAIAERLRKEADSGEIEIPEREATVLAEAVSPLDVTLVLNNCSQDVGGSVLDLTFGDWIVMTTDLEWE